MARTFFCFEVDYFGCHYKSKELATGYSQERFGGVHLQLMRLHDIEYCLQICYVVTFRMTFHCNIVYVAFHCFTYMLIKDYIHNSLICHPRILQSEGHHSIAIHPPLVVF